MRKSPKAARDANPDNAERKKMREHYKSLDVPKGKTPKIVRTPQREIDESNKRLAKHFKSQKHSKEDLSSAQQQRVKHRTTTL